MFSYCLKAIPVKHNQCGRSDFTAKEKHYNEEVYVIFVDEVEILYCKITSTVFQSEYSPKYQPFSTELFVSKMASG